MGLKGKFSPLFSVSLVFSPQPNSGKCHFILSFSNNFVLTFAPLTKLLLICKKKPLCPIVDLEETIIYIDGCSNFPSKCGEKGPPLETSNEHMAQEKQLMKRKKDKTQEKKHMRRLKLLEH